MPVALTFVVVEAKIFLAKNISDRLRDGHLVPHRGLVLVPSGRSLEISYAQISVS